jgi:hypothetical protein
VKKLAAMVIITAMCLTLFPISSQAKTSRTPGGIPAFLVGCCWGIREGSEWNEGADLHWREWCRLIPIVNIVIGVWDGIDCYKGMGAHDWAKANGANWY